MPSKVVLPPVEFCRGTRPSQAARSRAFRNWRASPTAAINAVAPIGPMPGIVMSRRAVSSFAASTSTCRETTASLISTVLSSSQSSLRRPRIARVRSFVSSVMMRAMSSLNAPVPGRMGIHTQGRKRAFGRLGWVRLPTKRSRTRCKACKSICSQDLISTNRIVGRVTASAMASASRASFLFDFTNGLTNCAGIIRTELAQLPCHPLRTWAGFHAD